MNKLDLLRTELEKARKKLNDKGYHYEGNAGSYDDLMNVKPFEIAYQDVIEKIWPDNAWWEITRYWDIFDAMASGLSDEAVIDEICKHVDKEFINESKEAIINGVKVEYGHTLKEYIEKFGESYDNGYLWDYLKEDFENGTVESQNNVVYWYMEDLNGEWRYFETNIANETKTQALSESLSADKKKLTEGTSNFGSLDNFPLLVFYTIDELYWNMHHDPDYPKEEDFETELDNGDFHIDYDAFEDAKDTFEQKYWDENDICVLDEDEQERLKDKLYDFNEESKRMAWDADVVDGEQQYGDNLNLEDVKLEIEPGYYEAAYINVENERYLDYLDDDFKAQQMERFNKFFDEIKKEFGLTELSLAYRASNGETGYNIVKDESLEEKKIKKKYKVSFTGDPEKNVAFFNHAMGSDKGGASVEQASVSLGEDVKRHYYEAELGIILEPDDKEYDSYKMDGVYGGELSFYDENQFAFSEDELDKYKEDCKKYVDEGVNDTYAIIKGPFDLDDGINVEDIGEFCYDLDCVIWSYRKDKDGNIIEDFLKVKNESLEESCSDKELVDKLVAFGTCADEEEAKERVAKMSQEDKEEMCKSLKRQAQDHLLNDSLKEDKEVARVEYCVMDKDNNNIECFDNTDDAIAFAKENEGVRVLEVQYGPKDENGDEPELGFEEVWSIRESLKESNKFEVHFEEDDMEASLGGKNVFDNKDDAIACADDYHTKGHAAYVVTIDSNGKVVESLNESIDFEEMKRLLEGLENFLREEDVYYELWFDEKDDTVNAEIEWGDWKHDHLWFDHVAEQYLNGQGYEVTNINVDVTDEDGSDTYSAIHSLSIRKKSKVEEGASYRGLAYFEYPEGTGCHIRETPSCFVATDKHGTTIGDSKTIDGAKALIDAYLKSYEAVVEGLDDGLSYYYVKYWEDEELRDQGISEIYMDDFKTKEEAIHVARRLIDFMGYASVEVFYSPEGDINESDDELVFGYDGIDTWGNDRDESLKEDVNSKGEKIAKLIAKAYKGMVGPFGGEDPYVNGNKVTFHSQGPDESWIFNDDGSVDFDETEDEFVEVSNLDDYGCDSEEELRDYFNEIKHFDSVEDLFNSGLSWFMEVPNEKEILKKIDNILKESLNEDAQYCVHLKVKDENGKVVREEDLTPCGSKTEMEAEKKHLEEVSPEDSHHNRNFYSIKKL